MEEKEEYLFNKTMDNDIGFQELINGTRLKITGLAYVTIEPVEKEIIIHLDSNIRLSITHCGEFVTISVDDKEHYLESDSLKYEILL